METRKFEKNPVLAKAFSYFLVGIGLVVLAVMSFIFIKPYGILIAIALIVLSIIVDILGVFRALLYVNCPTCARSIKRKNLQKAEYPCEVCGINWVLETQG